MDLAAYFWLSGLITGTAYLSIVYRTEFAFNIPFHFGCITLAVTGATLIIASNLSSRFTSPPTPPSASYIPISESESIDFDSPLRKASVSDYGFVGVGIRRSLLQRRQAWALLAVFVVVVCSRLEMARWVMTHTQCAALNLAPMIPLLTVTLSHLLNKYDLLSAASGTAKPQPLRKSDQDLYRRLLAAAFLSFGSYMAIGSLPYLRSNYICNRASVLPYAIPVLQILGTCLDVFLIILIDRIVFRGSENKGPAPVLRLADPGWAALVAYSVLACASLAFYKQLPVHRYWYTQMPGAFFLSALKIAVVFALTCLSGLQLNRRLGFETSTFIVCFVAVNGDSFSVAGSSKSTYLPLFGFKVVMSLIVVYLGMVMLLYIEAAHNSHSIFRSQRFTSVSRRLLFGLLLLFLAQVTSWYRKQPEHRGSHPIQSLMAHAEEEHAKFLSTAATSRTVTQAAKEYRRRYTNDPPPRFDRWFKYATEHDSLVIDDFDNMYADLSPFWSLSPGDIRLRTWESISNPWNNIGGILVRKGKAELLGHPPESHRWMLEGFINMTEPFVKWLPDMDIAVNLNDEPRSAMVWGEVQDRLAIARGHQQLPPRDNGDFEADRSWMLVPGEPLEDSRYREGSFHDSFFRYGVVGCHKSTRARRERHWNLRHACASCLAEHTQFHFVSDWRAAADPCHQPDFADNYGLHSSPSTFKATNELMPVFSQSKPYGYNDLLYPSPWNWVERTKYAPNSSYTDPDFAGKQTTLFWRGGTSEGKSTGSGAWKGMARQRLIHLCNNATEDERSLLLLPTGATGTASATRTEQTYRFRELSPSALHKQLSTDVYMVRNIDRCANRDCLAQHAEFHPEYFEAVDFQENWQYKYLVDLDGAGFSGRFIPFLQSKSVPFKASLAREWWEPRVTAWLHFIPLDIRLTEVWSILAYFMGWKEEENRAGGARWLLTPHEREAEKIANEGREVARKLLRKEDMEIYLFRLLLEYGRLTDDRRDELGWTGDKHIG